MSRTKPLNLPKWLEENSHLLQPPIGNYCVYDEGFTVMIVGGAAGNARTDYHINQTPEWFYQYRGSMLLKTVQNAGTPQQSFVDIPIGEGEMYLLAPNTPHNPVRFPNTVGIVIEQERPEGSLDRLRWYCQNCESVVYEDAFHCTDLGTQIKDAVNKFRGDEELRKCKNCGALADVERKKEIPGENPA